jgi:hypothetical protein
VGIFLPLQITNLQTLFLNPFPTPRIQSLSS